VIPTSGKSFLTALLALGIFLFRNKLVHGLLFHNPFIPRALCHEEEEAIYKTVKCDLPASSLGMSSSKSILLTGETHNYTFNLPVSHSLTTHFVQSAHNNGRII